MTALLLCLLSATAVADDAIATKPTVMVDMEWRGMYAAEHLSHGPGFGFAVGILNDHLRLGVHGYARPGPWNPATFTLSASEPFEGAFDGSYNGQDSLELRSDGGVLGPSIQVGTNLTDKLRADVGAIVGYGGYGFYLVGDQRKTPDGERTSVWENRLMDGRDSYLGLGIDAGPRFTWAASDHLRPYLAVRYQTIVGYNAFMKPDYNGVSAVLGVSAGRF